MKITLKQIGSPWIFLLMLIIGLWSAFEILITWNTGVSKNYPAFIPVILTLLIISVAYLIWYLTRVVTE